MSDPRAYFLTWTCYGTWLPGDARGSVDREHNRFGDAIADPSASRTTHHQSRLKGRPIVLDDAMRQVVEETIQDHCRLRRWALPAINARTNHVHVVVASGDVPPGRAMGQFKSWSTRRLRELGFISADQPVWTTGGSSRFLWDDDSVARACRYVVDGQGAELS